MESKIYKPYKEVRLTKRDLFFRHAAHVQTRIYQELNLPAPVPPNGPDSSQFKPQMPTKMRVVKGQTRLSGGLGVYSQSVSRP